MKIDDAMNRVIRELYHITDPSVLDTIQTHACINTYEKGSIIKSRGEKQFYAAFLLRGVVRFYFLSGKGEELTDSFISDFGYPVMTPDFSQPAFMTSEAITCTELLMIPLNIVLDLIERSNQVLWAYIQMLNWALLFHWQIKTSRVCFSVSERYAWFKCNFPEADSTAYGKHIASFLGMTPETLSRIRNKELAEAYPVMVNSVGGYSSDMLLQTLKRGVNSLKGNHIKEEPE